MNQKTIAIVGGGQAAAMAAAALRQQGFDGELHLFSDEQHQPYERPPLSKAMLLDDNPQLQPILPAGWWREHNVQLHLGVTVQTLGRQTHQLMLADGQSYPWDRLLIATGAAARPLPLLDKLGDRCFTLRHAADAERLRGTLLPGKSIVIVGAGTIGLELAASATQRGCQVTVVELAPTVMGRNAPAPVRDYLLARHQQAGVRVLLNSAIEHAEARECLSLTLQNGETLLADAMVYGIGIVANDALAREAGLETANGIIVDSACRQLAYELAPKVRVNGVGPCGMATDLRGPQALGQNDTSIMQSLTPEKIAAILPLQFFPEPADFTGPYVMLASKRNNRTLSGVMINADAGLGIRGIRHVAAGLDL